MLSSANYLSQGSHQGHLEKVLLDTFKGVNIKVNAKETEVRNPITGNRFELDFWIASLRLGFEFQDSYHFAATWYTQIPLGEVQHIDRLKRERILRNRINLISVPCWWDFSAENLHASIHFERPDLLPNASGLPISLNPPLTFFTESNVPQVGDVMLASFLHPVGSTNLFASKLSEHSPWWIGEKYDGVRAVWNPIEKQLYSRRAIEIQIPGSLLQVLNSCKVFLDAEAWQGRGLYSSLGSIGHGRELLRIIAFDDPSPNNQRKPFEKRYENLVLSVQSDDLPFLLVAFRISCYSESDFTFVLNCIIKGGGEGVIARKPFSLYEHGRSSSVIKIKSAQDDTEGLVVKVARNYFVIELPTGIKFKVKKEESDVDAKTGEVVTFEYENFSRKEVPINPRVTRVRKDLTWEDVLRDFKISQTKGGFTTKPTRFWEDVNNVRNFFEDFANKHEMNPYDPETWYSTSRASIEATKGGERVFVAQGGYAKAVMTSFPNIGLDVTKFERLPIGYYQDVNIRRETFLQFAKENNFDPLVADNWYFHRLKSFVEFESAGDIVKYYGSVKRALVHLFPELKFDSSNLGVSYWGRPKNRRSFFDKFARKHKFDPLLAENWYSISRLQIMQEANAKIVLHYYHKSIVNALIDLYPEVEFDKRKFSKKRKDFFDAFAKDHGFDPLVQANWHKVSRSEIMKRKHAIDVMAMDRGSVVKTLLRVYPNIGLKPDQFRMLPDKYWANTSNQRAFFEEFASSNNMDPLIAKTWYSLQHKLPSKSLNYILSLYKGSFPSALKYLFPNMQLDKSKLQIGFWANTKNRRAFFEKFAKSHGFDPLSAESWYNISRKTIFQNKSSSYVIQYYKNSYSTALKELFPEIGINENMFSHVSRRHWANTENQKEFFIQLAQEIGFDPLNPEMWYKVSRKQVLTKRGGQSVIEYYSKNYHTALLSLFPSIGLDPNKFEFTGSPLRKPEKTID